ncbi:chromosome partition protein Smc-like [Watersipora subatra]|uniref:chromosome partition protein Smc-like n=1 Tax=Watersipora subatra TaxID=2589382 RepID=UPI00355B4CF2
MAAAMLSAVKLPTGSCANSVYALKQYIQNLPVDADNSPPAIYVRWYIANMAYLKSLKINFDERIYAALVTYYQKERARIETLPNSKENTILSEFRAPSAASVLKFKDDLPEVSDLYDFADVENISSRLKYIRQRWQLLMEDEIEITPTLFSCDSLQRVPEGCPKEIDSLLRLVPDLLVKCEKAGSLALLWLQCASSKAIDIQSKYSKLERVKSVLTEKLSGLSEEIEQEEIELEAKSTDLETLTSREERANEIMAKSRQIDYNIKQLEEKIRKHLFRNGSLIADTSPNHELSADQLEVLRLEKEKELLIFEKGLLEEDLAVELEVKPNIIRFTEQIQEHCEILEQDIDNKRHEKQEVESALIPVLADRNQTEAKLSEDSRGKETL